MTSSPPFSAALFKSITAALGVETRPTTDAFGRPDFTINRAGMEQLRDGARAVGENDFADRIQQMLDAGGRKDLP
ncbi:hypothetical protein [Streptomyces antarcticus]|uniref:hypothetical protein n=1 Tax=Streptomyces antarcticus TaxID=2996458 RepID=UPI00226DC39E|nr:MULTISPECIES: hypothetical protein [unclassified Streptomyces]MCY0943564.1 hypothetical protein [Streptomyces sp. H34-AA3]MCZ4083527.1 hypothetical protein [Streptomyces sp. H34-S5]